jgi:hypothetical protein
LSSTPCCIVINTLLYCHQHPAVLSSTPCCIVINTLLYCHQHPAVLSACMQVGLQLGSKDWRNRMDALRALSALGPALPEVPNAALEGLLQALVGRLNDGNAKVNQKALEVGHLEMTRRNFYQQQPWGLQGSKRSTCCLKTFGAEGVCWV